jgi:DNA-binding NtrC family response regulator
MNKILVVDDDIIIRMYLVAVLSDEGFRARAVGSGKEAIAAYQAEPAALVILDVYMPHMDGVETFQALYAMDPRLKAIGISGNGSMLSVACLKMMSALGALAVLEKPFRKEAFIKTVRKILTLHTNTPATAHTQRISNHHITPAVKEQPQYNLSAGLV